MIIGCGCHFMQLPTELLQHIGSYLPARDLVRSRGICRALVLTHPDAVWRRAWIAALADPEWPYSLPDRALRTLHPSLNRSRAWDQRTPPPVWMAPWANRGGPCAHVVLTFDFPPASVPVCALTTKHTCAKSRWRTGMTYAHGHIRFQKIHDDERLEICCAWDVSRSSAGMAYCHFAHVKALDLVVETYSIGAWCNDILHMFRA
jgi:hypothetical protein